MRGKSFRSHSPACSGIHNFHTYQKNHSFRPRQEADSDNSAGSKPCSGCRRRIRKLLKNCSLRMHSSRMYCLYRRWSLFRMHSRFRRQTLTRMYCRFRTKFRFRMYFRFPKQSRSRTYYRWKQRRIPPHYQWMSGCCSRSDQRKNNCFRTDRPSRNPLIRQTGRTDFQVRLRRPGSE